MSIFEKNSHPNEIIRLSNVGKIYRLSSPTKIRLLSLFMQSFAKPSAQQFSENTKKALAHIHLSVSKGEKVGLIGANGSGKSTLVKLVSGKLQPSEGVLDVKGKIQTLLPEQTGTNEQMTGKDFIRSSLILNGLQRKQEKQAYQDVIDFVELGDSINHPIRIYSLGMKARLEFAVVTAIQPDILLIDEVLGAGDGYFSKKCADRIHNLVNQTTLLLVSHSMGQILEFCDRAIWLNEGEIIEDGTAEDVVKLYEKFMVNKSAESQTKSSEEAKNSPVEAREANLEIQNTKIKEISRALFLRNQQSCSTLSIKNGVFSPSNSKVMVSETGEEVEIEISLHASIAFPEGIKISVYGINDQGKLIWDSHNKTPPLEAGDTVMTLSTKKMIAGVGDYFISIAVQKNEAHEAEFLDVMDAGLYLKLLPTNHSDAPFFHCPAAWSYGDEHQEDRNRISAWV